MSKVQVDTIVDKDDISAPTLSKGAIVTGVCTATTFVGAVTGDVTGNATGLTGSPNITVTDVNATGVTTTGIATVTTSVVVGSAVTANADGVITAGVGTFGSVVSSGAISGTTGTFTGQLSLNSIGSGDIVSELTADSPTFTYRNGSGAWFHAGKHPTEDAFIISDGASTTTNERLRVTSAGLVGVGTTIPDDNLAVRGSNGTGIRVGDGTANVLLGTGAGPVGRLYTITNHGLILGTNDSERLRIGTSGEIGIGGANYGTSGQVLTSGGSGAAPSWADAGGVWTKLASNSATSGTVFPVTTNGLSSTYFYYKILFYLTTADGSGVSFGVDFTTDNGSTWGSDSSSNYRYSNTGRQSNSNMGMDGTETYGYFMGSNTKEKWYGEINIVAPDLTTTTKGALAVYSASQIDDTHDGALSSNVTYRPSSNYLQAITGVRLVTSGAVNYINWSLLASAL